MANIRDVAEKANVAKCTVSRVLNGSESVSQKTREKVLRVIQELDYTPNELARGMFKQKSGIVAMLVPSIRHPFFSSLASCIEVELFKQGYKLMMCGTNDVIERERDYMKIFKSNMIDGIILGVKSLETSVYTQFQKPLILLDDYINDTIPVVVSDHSEGGKLAADVFIRSGCKNVIHLCNVDSHTVLSFNSHSTLMKILTSHNIKAEPVDIQWNTFDFSKYYELAKKILEDDATIDGVMAADMPALAFLKAALRLGKKVPEEFCVIAYDGTYVAEMNVLEITTIVQPLKEIAESIVEIMMKLIDDIPIDISIVTIPVSLKMGETT